MGRYTQRILPLFRNVLNGTSLAVSDTEKEKTPPGPE